MTGNSTSTNGNEGKGLWRRPRLWFLFGIPLGGFLMFFLGAIALGTFNGIIHYTSTLEFCKTCHEMRDFVFEEYKETVHYQNASGVRASCADCHIPEPWFPKVVRKVKAGLNEVPHKILGTIGTPEKFEAHRLELAERVWDSMKATNSRECRSCHSIEAMQTDLQDRSARRKHTLERMQERDETCIDCHKGVAHKLPEGY